MIHNHEFLVRVGPLDGATVFDVSFDAVESVGGWLEVDSAAPAAGRAPAGARASAACGFKQSLRQEPVLRRISVQQQAAIESIVSEINIFIPLTGNFNTIALFSLSLCDGAGFKTDF